MLQPFIWRGFKSFNLFCQECKIDYDQVEKEPIHVFLADVVSDDEDDNDDDDVSPPSTSHMMQPATTFWRFLTKKKKPKTITPATTLPTARTTDFNLDGRTTNDAPKPVVIEEEEERQPLSEHCASMC